MPRLEVAVVTRGGDAQIVNAARPASLVAFSDAHENKVMPETMREIAFVVHHALGVAEPLDEWLDTLEDVSAAPEDVERARRIMAGDEEERQRAIGELPPEEEKAHPPPEPEPEEPEPEEPAEEPTPEEKLVPATPGGS
jgi:hypothetical protein